MEQIIIDTSANPGRCLLRNGYYEVVAAEMWLGERFWQLTGSNKSKVEKTEWLRTSTPVPGVIKVEAAAKCFTTDKGATGELQRKLRSLLFQERL